MIYIFNVMDESGDGNLQADEIHYGLKEILYYNDEKKEAIVTPEEDEALKKECQEILERVDLNKNGFITFSEFLVASIDCSRESITKYCKVAYKQYFHNDTEDIE